MKKLLGEPAILLLVLCILITYFILAFQLVKNQKYSELLSTAFTLIIFFLIPRITLFPWSNIHPEDATRFLRRLSDASSLVQIGFFSSISILLHSRFRHFTQDLILLFQDPFLGLMLFATILSTFWSDTPVYTLRCSIILFLTSALAANFARVYNWKKIFNFLLISQSIVMILSIFYSLFVPSVGMHGKGWKGIMTGPNQLALLMGLTTVLWYFNSIRQTRSINRWGCFLMAGCALFTMDSTNSGTAKIAFLALIGLFFFLRFIRSLNFYWAFSALVVFLSITGFMYILITENLNAIFEALGKEPTLTGRTNFWPFIVQGIKDRLWLGYGYNGFWQPWRGEEDPASIVVTDVGFHPPHAHNGFLEIGLELGLVGWLLFGLSFFRNLAMSVLYMIKHKEHEAMVPILLITFLVVPNITYSELFKAEYIWFYYVMSSVRLSIDVSADLRRMK